MKQSMFPKRVRRWGNWFRESRLGRCLEEGITEASILLIISGVLKLTSVVLEYEEVVNWAVVWIETAHQTTLVMAAGWLSFRLLWTVIESDLKAIRELQRDMKAIKHHREDVEEIVDLLDDIENVSSLREHAQELNEVHRSIDQSLEEFEARIGNIYHSEVPNFIEESSIKGETEVERTQE